MIIRVDAIFSEFSAHDLRGAVRNDFIGVHVVTRPRARLDGIDHKLVIPFPVYDFLRSLDDRVGAVMIEQAKITIDLSRGAFDHRHRPDKCWARLKT